MPLYICRRTAGEIEIDGLLNEESWRRADPAAFRLHDDSAPPPLITIARLCYDDTCLYVAFECEDTEIEAKLTRRDDPIFDEEVVEIFLDADSDGLTYYEFEVSPLNTIFDGLVRNPTGVKGEIDTSWDCDGLRTAVSRGRSGDESWSVEMAIPFASLPGAPNTPPKPGDRWRMNLYRIERAPREEYICWSPTRQSPANYHAPAMFGTVEFG